MITRGIIAAWHAAGQSGDAGLFLAASGNRPIEWPTAADWWRVVSLADYNTRVVVSGTALLGAAAGLVGCFTLLRRRALLGDALSHATLPGICLAFLLATSLGGDGKSMPWLLLGATLSGVVGVGAVLAIARGTRLKEDAAMGIVLGVLFGVGVALLGIVQQSETGHAAGLEAFIYGKTASMTAADAGRISVTSAICVAASVLLFKEWKLLCFDGAYAASRGYPVAVLDIALMGLVVAVCIVGLQAVGLILVIALLVIPAASARFWTDRMGRMMGIAALMGASGSLGGAIGSAVFTDLPSGALIVLVCGLWFLVSLFFGRRRGLLVRGRRRRRPVSGPSGAAGPSGSKSAASGAP